MRPINITKIHFDDVTRTQPQARQKQHHGAVPESDGGVAITSSDDALDVGRRQVSGQCGKTPHGERRHSIVHS
jgi:hypothetical protein